MLKHKGLLWLIGTVVAIGLASIYSYAQAGGTTITICVRHNGTVAVVGAGFRSDDCRGSSQLLSWNIQGPTGPPGPIGPQGPAGAGGSFDPSHFYYRYKAVRLPPNNEFGGISGDFADCDAGDTIISGGASANFDGVHILASYPIGSGSWYGAASNQDPVEKTLTVVARCFDSTP